MEHCINISVFTNKQKKSRNYDVYYIKQSLFNHFNLLGNVKNWTKFLDNHSSDDNSLSQFKKNLNENFTPIPPVIVNNITAYNDEDKAEFFASCYALQFFTNSAHHSLVNMLLIFFSPPFLILSLKLNKLLSITLSKIPRTAKPVDSITYIVRNIYY